MSGATMWAAVAAFLDRFQERRVVGIDEQRFGPVVDGDEYATMRMDALLADQQRNERSLK
jgi:hypothetical protein